MASRRRSNYSGWVGLIVILLLVRACAPGTRISEPEPAPTVVQNADPAPSAALPLVSPQPGAASAPAVEPGPVQANTEPDQGTDADEGLSNAIDVANDPIAGPPRADTLLIAANNLANAGRKSAAIDFYSLVVKQYYGTTQAATASERIRSLGGTAPLVPEIERWTPKRELERYPVVEPRITARTVPRTEARTQALDTPRYDPPLVSRDYGAGYSSDKTVHVQGYYRKNGTYVQPHYRRPPRR